MGSARDEPDQGRLAGLRMRFGEGADEFQAFEALANLGLQEGIGPGAVGVEQGGQDVAIVQ